ncbi:MAG: alpha/beta hydrolase [Candidatus Omnitrophica bacterium]|nr:alpha/beta hydrolase [Candidatus Omnitrophota bacterium]
MISQTSKFKLFNKGFDKTIVLIPGWASDYRIFNSLELNYNYLLPVEFYPFNFAQDLKDFLDRESIGRVSLFGWSMGGFAAADFAAKNPDRVDELILVSIQKKYVPELLEDIKLKLKQNKKAFLYKLYFNCFSREDNEGLDWFKSHLLMPYVDELSLDELLRGLDYLLAAQINPGSLAGIRKIRIFHGEDDKVASLESARQIKLELPQAEFISLAGIGHTPFLNRQFKEKFING